MICDPAQREIVAPIALAGIQRTRRVADAGEQPDARAARQHAAGGDREKRQRRSRRDVHLAARSRLQPFDAEQHGQGARAPLGLQHRAFEGNGLAPSAVELRVEQRAVQRRVARRRTRTAAAQHTYRKMSLSYSDGTEQHESGGLHRILLDKPVGLEERSGQCAMSPGKIGVKV